MGKLLNFNGRIRRMGWWIAPIVIGIVSSIVNELRDVDGLNLVLAFILGAVAFVITLISISINVRRWHDLNKSGWWILINLIPILGWIYSFVMLGFMPGDQGNNRFGPPPREGAIL